VPEGIKDLLIRDPTGNCGAFRGWEEINKITLEAYRRGKESGK